MATGLEDRVQRATSLAAADAAVTLNLPSGGTFAFQVTGTMTSATLTFEASVDGTTYVAVPALKVGSGTKSTTTTTTGIYLVSIPAMQYVRARTSTYGSGTVLVTGRASVTPLGATDLASTGGSPASPQTVTSTPAALNAATTMTLSGEATVGIATSTSADWNGTITFEATVDGTNWFAHNIVNINGGAIRQTATTANTNSAFQTNVAGYAGFRVRISTYVAGSVGVTLVGNASPSAISLNDLIGATVLMKSEDGTPTNNDSGVAVLGIRNDAVSASFTASDSKYQMLQFLRESARVVSGGYTTVIASTLTRPNNTTAYAAGDELTDTGAAILTLTSAARVSGGSGVIQGVVVTFSTNWTTKPSLELWIFDTTSTPTTDNLAFAPTDAVVDTCLAVIPLTASYVGEATTGAGSSTTGNMVMDTGPINYPFLTVGSANLFLRVVVRNAGQAGAGSDTVKFRVRVSQD